ncbi:hypothetical protein BGZ83_006507 [Gryganskiella cystojenkinii]|nr:hypothetical protein BGZ83_006507 [Gryganskiella cystojenkinii]
MKGKAPILVLSQQPQQPQQQQQQQQQKSFGSPRLSSSCARTMSQQQHHNHRQESRHQQQQSHLQHNSPKQQQPHQRRGSSNPGTVAQKQQHQYQQYSYQHDRALHKLDNHYLAQNQHNSQHSNHFHPSQQQQQHQRSPSNRVSGARSPPARIPTPTNCLQAGPATSSSTSFSATASRNSIAKIPSFVVSADPASPPSSAIPSSSSSSLLSNISMPFSTQSAVTLAAAATVASTGISDAHNSDPEPASGEMEQYIQQQQQQLQTNRHSQESRSPTIAESATARSLLAVDLGLGLHPPVLESDFSSSSSLRESSDYDTMETEDDDKGVLASDSNDTDSVVDDSLDLDRRSRRRRSMQRLVAKNKTLKSSLAQAKSDLASERQNRAAIDQIYLRIKKELNGKLEAEELKVANLRAELEQMQLDMQELKDKQASSAYKIGYDSSPYSLSSGFGGLMLHHSNFDEPSEDLLPVPKPKSNKEAKLLVSCESTSNSSSRWQDDEPRPENMRKDDIDLEQVDQMKQQEKEVKVSFSQPESEVQRASDETVQGEVSDDDDDDDEEEEHDNDEAPCTMMEILLKKQHSRTPEDDAQDPPADANETFDSMAHKFLHQALLAKFTPARTILQLDDLLLKYDAVSEDLILVLAQDFMKWWEKERVEAGGAAAGGWGTNLVLMADSGDRVSAKIAVETKFKSIFVPLLLHYVASHREQLMLLEKLERNAKTNDRFTRNHVSQLMALYKFDVLDADAILEWWRLLKEPKGVFGHGDGLRSMSSKFVAWLEDEEDESEDDSDDSDNDNDDDDDLSDDNEDDGVEFDEQDEQELFTNGEGKIVGLDQLLKQDVQGSQAHSIRSLNEDLDEDEARKEELMVIGSDDDPMDDQASTTSSLERLEECERKRRISFCTNNVYIQQDGKTRVDRAPSEEEDEKHSKRFDQCPPLMEQVDEEEEEETEDNDIENDSD